MSFKKERNERTEREKRMEQSTGEKPSLGENNLQLPEEILTKNIANKTKQESEGNKEIK
jgi:hypothetical protein